MGKLDNLLLYIIGFWYRIFRTDYDRRKHLIIGFVDRQLTVRIFNHEDFVEEVILRLEKIRKKVKPGVFIRQALEETRDCKFIAFQCGRDDEFIQFWRGDGNIMLDFPMLKTNGLGKYRYQVLGLLAEKGFCKMKNPGKLLNYFFDIKPFGEGETIQANFAKDIDTTTDFCFNVFTKIFNQDLKYLSLKIG